MIGMEQDEGKAFIVAQQNIIRGAITFDQLRFEQQRLSFAVGRDNRHRPRQRDHPPQPVGQSLDLRIIGDTVAQRARLADIENIAARIVHPIDARSRGQGREHIADRGDPRLEIGLIGAAHRISSAFLVEAIGCIGRRHDARLGVKSKTDKPS